MSIVKKVGKDLFITLLVCLVDILLSSPIICITILVSAFNDVGTIVDSILLDKNFVLMFITPIVLVQVVIYVLGVKKNIKYKFNRFITVVVGICMILCVYAFLSARYAPNSLFIKLIS